MCEFNIKLITWLIKNIYLKCHAKIFRADGVNHFIAVKKLYGEWQGNNPFDINLRTIIAFREIGKGYAGLKSFRGFMNMLPPMTELTFKLYCSKECREEKSYIGRLKTTFIKATHRKHIIHGLSYMYACTLV